MRDFVLGGGLSIFSFFMVSMVGLPVDGGRALNQPIVEDCVWEKKAQLKEGLLGGEKEIVCLKCC